MILLGIDPSLSNTGLVLVDENLTVLESTTLTTSSSKQRIKSFSDIQRMKATLEAFYPWLDKADKVYAEAPTGSQSSRAMVSYGFSCALLAMASHIPTVLVSPMDIKKYVGLSEKEDIIDWVESRSPNWLPRDKKGRIIKAKASHQADAYLALLTGIHHENSSNSK